MDIKFEKTGTAGEDEHAVEMEVQRAQAIAALQNSKSFFVIAEDEKEIGARVICAGELLKRAHILADIFEATPILYRNVVGGLMKKAVLDALKSGDLKAP